MIGIIPAAGHATRINGIAKYLLPTPSDTLIGVLRRRMTDAGADRVLIGVGAHSCDALGLPNALLYTVNSATMSETVLAARPFVGNDNVLFGMPDSHWDADDVFQRLAQNLDDGALVIAALFETKPSQRHKLGMCAVGFDSDDNLKVTRVVDKPQAETIAWSTLHLAWGAMAWRADFWRYIRAADPHVGYALQRAVESRGDVRAQLMRGHYFDCGTPDEYFACIRHLTEAVEVA